MKLLPSALPLLALGAATLLLLPGREALGFSKGGFSVGLSAEAQRDFRVFDNFADPQSNDNLVQHAQFPGWSGAEAAIWKACVEWGSEAHGNGSGDPLQSVVGSGGANFDAYWAGAASSIGSPNGNVHSAITSCSSGVLAFTEIPTSDGWRIRYCDGSWTWHDGPDDNPSSGNDFDLQGVAAHEYGHALGLGHSGVSGATMFPSVSSSGSSNIRSIESDDVAGVQCIYGPRLVGFKPHIDSVAVNGSQVTITGTGFSPTGGEVWFTNRNVSDAFLDPRVRVLGVDSANNGTLITVTIPDDAGPGDVFVKKGRAGYNTLSNAFPFDGTGMGAPLSISGMSPPDVENLVVGTAQTVTVLGSGFSPTFQLEIDGERIAGSSSWISDGEVRFEWEPLATLGMHTLTVIDNGLSASTGFQVVANASPALQVGDGEPGTLVATVADLGMGGQPGDLHYVLVSTSGAPSVLPGKVALAIGNSFQELTEVGIFQIGVDGLATASVPLTGVVATTLHWQSLRIVLPLGGSFPLAASNAQSSFTP